MMYSDHRDFVAGFVVHHKFQFFQNKLLYSNMYIHLLKRCQIYYNYVDISIYFNKIQA